jgi:hypothetical protein
MISRLLVTASLAGLLSVGSAIAQEQETQPIVKPGASDGGQSTEMPAGDAGKQAQTGQEVMPRAEEGAAAQAQSGDEVMPKVQDDAAGQSQSADTQGMDNDNTNATKRKLNKEQAADQAGEDQKKVTQDDNKKRKQQQGDQAEKAQPDADKQQSADKKAGDDENLTTGSTEKPEITAEKRTIIREKIVTKNVTKIDRDDLDFDVSVGVVVPTTIAVQPLPVEVVEIVPEYRDYLYFVLADGTIVIVEPGSMQIVTMITV